MTGVPVPSPSALLAAARRSPSESARRLGRRLSAAETLVGRELVSGPSVRLPLGRRLALLRHGFTSRAGVLFGVEPGEWDRYLSEYRVELLGNLGGEWGDLAGNKLASRLLLGSFADHLPDLHGVVDGGRVLRDLPTVTPDALDAPDASDVPDACAPGGSAPTDAGEWVAARLDAAGTADALVLKPVSGYGGSGVFVCRRAADGEGYVVNGEPKSPDGFAAFVDDLEEYLVSEFVRQADYADRLFPDAVNTLRVVTLNDGADGPFVAGAVHRVGTEMSAPVDNWSRGGLSAEVTDDGTLSSGARWSSAAGELEWFDDHPDTGDPVAGVGVPGWPAVRERVLEMAAALPSLARIGWDVVLTDEGDGDGCPGFVVIELNSHPGVETLQIHRPLLDDARVRRFYERHGHA